MTRAVKLVFFLISLLAMAIFAGGSLLMANNEWGLGGIVLLVAVGVIACGFVYRRRVLGKRS